jgi:hypothetical protein
MEQGLVSHYKDLGVGTVYTSTMLINQHDIAVLRNYVQGLAAPITTRANLFSGRKSTARICASKLIPTLQRSLASIQPLWRAVKATGLAPDTRNWVPLSFGSNRGVLLSCFLPRVLVRVSDGQMLHGSHCKVACSNPPRLKGVSVLFHVF